MSGESRYIRNDRQVARLRSGDGVDCEYCGAKAGEPCKRQGRTGVPLLRNHLRRRLDGAVAADALIVGRGKVGKR